MEKCVAKGSIETCCWESKSNRRRERRRSSLSARASVSFRSHCSPSSLPPPADVTIPDVHGDACSRKLYRVLFLSSRSPRAADASEGNPMARRTMRSPSKVPAATRPGCGNIYTGVACTRPSLRPCTPLRGSRSPPRFLKIYREIGSVGLYMFANETPVPSPSRKTIVSNNVSWDQDINSFWISNKYEYWRLKCTA